MKDINKVYFYPNSLINLIRDNYNIIPYYIKISLANLINRRLKNYFIFFKNILIINNILVIYYI